MTTTLEHLLDAADALAKRHACPPRPDFPIPLDLIHKNTAELLERKATDKKGIGWFAKQDLPTGTILMVAKPIVMVMEHEDIGDEEEEEVEEEMDVDEEDESPPEESRLNWKIVLEMLQKISKKPELWTNVLNELFPRNPSDLSKLSSLDCKDDHLKQQIQEQLEELKQQNIVGSVVDEISQRLPLIVRYNVLSIETCPELLSHPEGHANLAGVGLYHEPSFFNHSARPNVARWAVGDVMYFVTNQEIATGTEACLSYIEHDVLCESAYRRNQLLRMDFQEAGDEASTAEEEDGPDMPVVDSEVQNELMEMNPLERLNNIDELMLQAQGKAPPEEGMGGDDDNEATQAEWFQCDFQNLRILKAITLDGLGQSSQALRLWEECVEFTKRQLPPLDESSVVMRVQAALCASTLSEKTKAHQHADQAIEIHDKLFGGGTRRLRRRYQRDLDLSLRKTKPGTIDSLWPLA